MVAENRARWCFSTIWLVENLGGHSKAFGNSIDLMGINSSILNVFFLNE